MQRTWGRRVLDVLQECLGPQGGLEWKDGKENPKTSKSEVTWQDHVDVVQSEMGSTRRF